MKREFMKPDDDFKDYFSYDPITGLFRRTLIPKRSKTGLGKLVGQKHFGYLRLNYKGRMYYSHRAAWFYMTGEWPTEFIDHIDGNGWNNAWANLRQASVKENGWNRAVRKGSSTGYKGVIRNPTSKKRPFSALIWLDGKYIYLGRFRTAEEAHDRYVQEVQANRPSFIPSKERMMNANAGNV